VTTTDPVSDPERLAHELAAGSVRVRTLGDVLHDYARRAEHKSLAPDGTPVTGTTAGQLRTRPVESHPALTTLTGKEGNRLLERLSGEVADPTEYRSDLGPREDPWPTLVVPVLRAVGVRPRLFGAPVEWWSAVCRPAAMVFGGMPQTRGSTAADLAEQRP
jgi:hypothetical protein